MGYGRGVCVAHWLVLSDPKVCGSNPSQVKKAFMVSDKFLVWNMKFGYD